jgi:hypothetical protein
MRFNAKSKQFKLFKALKAGEALTESQIRQRFGLANPRASVSSLRINHGVAVYANEHKDTKGRKTVKYEIGTPSRRIVALGYKAQSMGITL